MILREGPEAFASTTWERGAKDSAARACGGYQLQSWAVGQRLQLAILDRPHHKAAAFHVALLVEFDFAEDGVEGAALHHGGDLVRVGGSRLLAGGEQDVGRVVGINRISALVMPVLGLVFLEKRLGGGKRVVILAEGEIDIRG